MANFKDYRHQNYDGGLNNASSRRDVERNQATTLENWDITKKGRLSSRDGLTQLGNTQSGTIYSGGVYKKKNGTSKLLINEGVNVKYLNGATFAVVGTTSTVSTAERMSYQNVIVEDKIYISSSNNGLFHWDDGAGGLTAVGSSISGNKIMWYQNHLFHINSVNISGTKYTNDVFWSDFGDPEVYTTPLTNRVNLPGEGLAITMNVLGNNLVLFKDSSYMFLTGYGATSWTITASSTSIANTDDSVGCVAVDGTVRVGANELWFIDQQGFIRKISQSTYGYESKVMSNNLDVDLNIGNLSIALASYDDDKVYFAVPSSGSTVNDLVLVFDRKASARNGGKEAWTTYTGWEVNYFLTYGSIPTLTIIGSTSKKVYSHTGGSDDGVVIDCRWDGKNDDYDLPERYKKYAYGYINSQAQNNEVISVHSAVDGSTFSKLKEFSLDVTGTPLGPTGSAMMGPTGSFILGGSEDREEKYYFYDGGGNITGKSVIMSIRASVDQKVYIDTFTNHFVVRSLK